MNGVLGRLDRIPRALRLLLGIASSLALLAYSGIVSISEFKYIIILLLVAISLAVVAVTEPRRKAVVDASERPAVALRIKALDESAPEALARILKDRAARTGLEYIVTSLISPEGSDSLLLIIGPRDSQVLVESEIIASLASALKNFRVEVINGPPPRISSLVEAMRPRRGSLPIVMAGSAMREAASRPHGRAVYIGRRIDSPVDVPIAIDVNDVLGHVGIFGSTGTGKSTTAATLACRLYRELDWSVVVLDWAGEYARLLSPCRPRVLDPVRDGVGVWPTSGDDGEGLVEVLSSALDLSGPQAYLLDKVVSSRVPESARELLEAIEALPEESKWDREVKRGLLRKIGILANRYPGLFAKSAEPLSTEGLVVVESSSIRTSFARRAFELLLLASEYYWRVENSLPPAIYIVDEAHNVFSGEQGFLARLMAESRKYGMSIVVITQSPSSVEPLVLNTSTKIVHALRAASDKNFIADTLGLRPSLRDRISKLRAGEALLYAPSLGEPVIVKIEFPQPATDKLDQGLIF